MNNKSVNKKYDVVIVGAGVVGGAVARELSRYDLKVLCLEKEADVCCGISKANTGIIHTPALVPQGTMKAAMTVRGARMFDKLSSELGFGYQMTGALVLGYAPEDEKVLEKYAAAGRTAATVIGKSDGGSAEYRILRGEELRRFEPALSDKVQFALYAPDAGRIIPYEYGIALWENAVANGVELKLNAAVTDVGAAGAAGAAGTAGWLVRTDGAEYEAAFVVNAAGHGSSSIGEAAGFEKTEINKVKGQYMILDRVRGPEINHILFQVPRPGQSQKGKGILVTRTVYGNIMIGPDARRQDDAADTSTDADALDEVVRGALLSVPGLDPAWCIKTFAGVRPKPASGDFVIAAERRFVHLCGIESPGLTSSPAIAIETVNRLKRMGLKLTPNKDFNPHRRPIVDKSHLLELNALPPDELKRRIALPAGSSERLVCRCEQVPEARILDALGRGLPVTTLDGVKRRTRAGQGRCQGGFCGERVRALLAKELGITEAEVTQRGNEPELERLNAAEIRKIYKDLKNQ